MLPTDPLIPGPWSERPKWTTTATVLGQGSEHQDRTEEHPLLWRASHLPVHLQPSHTEVEGGRRGREPARIDHFWSVFLSHQSAQPLPTPTQNGPHAWKRWEGVTLGCLCLQGELLGKSCHLWASLSSSMKWDTHEPQPSAWHVAGTCLSILLASSSPIRSCSGQGNLGAWGAVGWMGRCQPWPLSTAVCALSCSKHFTKHLLVSAHTSLGDCMVPVALKQRIYPLR